MCSAPWGWGAQYHGRYHEYCGGCLECFGGVQYRGGYHETCGDIISTVGGVQYRGWILYHLLLFEYRGRYHDTYGGFHEYHGGVQYCGGTQITKDYSPTVLNTLHGTQDVPHSTNDIPSGVHDIPHSTQDILHGINTHYTGVVLAVIITCNFIL